MNKYRACVIGLGRIASLFEDDPKRVHPCTHAGALEKLDNVENLKSALQFAYKERNSFETNVYAKYIKEYSPECFYNKHIEIYKQLLK